MHNLKYYYLKEKHLLIATLVEGEKIVSCYKDGSWEFLDLSLDELKQDNTVENIDLMDVLLMTFGCLPTKLYNEKGYEIYEEKVKVNHDPLDIFMKDFKEFAIDDYFKKLHNKERNLTYSAVELDIHYENSGYVLMLDEYFREFLLRKQNGEFSYVEITKKDNDYIIVFDKNITKLRNI